MLSYCVRQRKRTECIPNSETFVITKNGRNAMRCICAECGITKFRFISKAEMQGSGFDELIVKGLAAGAKGLYNLGKRGASRAIKSDYVKDKVKGIGKRYLNRAIDSLADDLSKKISGRGRGRGLDIHKAIGKLPKPKAGWTLPGHKYTGPYNDLERQVKWDRDTGQIYEIYDQPTGKTDAIAMQHDVDYSVCADKGGNVKSCKNVADKKMVRALDAIPWNERQWGHWLARNTINTKQKLGLGVKKNAKNLDTWEGLANELHKPIKRNFTKRRVISHNVDDIWCSDLVDMQKLSKWNRGYKYLLMVLDLFSKYGWIVPLKTKTGLEVAKAFESLFFSNKPKMLWVDKGKEYYNKNVLDLLAKDKIKVYSTENEEKSSVCERWNRTIKDKMYKRFTMQNNTVYVDILPKILASYNNSRHRSIGMTPIQARKPENYGKVYFNLYGDLARDNKKNDKPAFVIGDRVRISKYKRVTFDKGYTPNWTEEVFIIDEIRFTNPITYKIKDLNGEVIKGTFYREELQKTDQEVYRIEKIIRKSKGKALVKWKGYPDEFNSWVPAGDLKNL